MSKLYSQFFSSSTVIKDDASAESMNQDACGCITVRKNEPLNSDEFWRELFAKINQKLSEELSTDIFANSGSTFCAILYNPTTQFISTANYGNSRAYCFMQEVIDYRKRFLVSLTVDDNPILPLVEEKTAAQKDGATSDLHHIKPLILNFDINDIAASVQPFCRGDTALVKFYVASQGFCDVENFFTQENNPAAYFSQISSVKTTHEIESGRQVAPLKNFQTIKKDDIDYSRAVDIFKKYIAIHPSQKFTSSYFTDLAKEVGSKKDITVAEISLREFDRQLETQYGASNCSPDFSELLLTFVCDGHGDNGNNIARTIKEAVEEFAIEQNHLYSTQHPQVEESIISDDTLFTSAMLREATLLKDEKEVKECLQGKVIYELLEDALEDDTSAIYPPQGTARATSFRSLTARNLQNHLA